MRTEVISSKILSIIIPFYNVEPYIESLFDSIVPQMNESVELVCVEDGSTDGTGDTLKSLVERYRDTIDVQCVFHDHNKGLSAARNTGLDYSRGEYIIFLDSDDLLAEGAIEKILCQIEKGGEDIIFFNFIEFKELEKNHGNDVALKDPRYPDQRLMKSYLCSSSVDNRELKEKFFKDYIDNRRFYSWMFAAKKSLYMSTGIRFPEGVYFEDIYTSPKLVWHAKSIVFMNENIVYYRQNRFGIKGRINKKSRMDLYHSFDHLLNYFEEVGASRDVLSHLFYKSITYKRMAFWDLFRSDPVIDRRGFREDLKRIKSVRDYSFLKYMAERWDEVERYTMVLDFMFLNCPECFVLYQKIKGKILLSFCRIRKSARRCDYYRSEYGKIV